MSDARERRVELLLGRTVCDVEGETVGRLEDICADTAGSEVVVREFVVGPFGAAARLRLGNVLPSVLGLVGLGGNGRHYRVPWQLMDLSDADHPRVRCRRGELESRDA